MNAPTPDITLLLHAAASGDRRDLDALLNAVYQDMRRLAASHMDRERRNHTLQPTALVHEAYVKLLDQHRTDWKDRLHFFSIASRIIRRILIDHARAAGADKRGGSVTRVSVGDQEFGVPARDVDLLALDEAMLELAGLDEEQARIVELRYFGGCTIEEIGELLGLGKRTVDRKWHSARAWLFERLRDDPEEPA